jgi:hypothetical protein
MEPEIIFKITVTSPLSLIESRLNLISDKYNYPKGYSFVYLTADQFGLNVENIFDLDDYSSLIIACQRTIQHFLLIFNTADITVECIDFENELYNNFELKRIEPSELRKKMIQHMVSKLNYHHPLEKLINNIALNDIDHLILTNKFIS